MRSGISNLGVFKGSAGVEKPLFPEVWLRYPERILVVMSIKAERFLGDKGIKGFGANVTKSGAVSYTNRLMKPHVIPTVR
jgi:hypothetical protein